MTVHSTLRAAAIAITAIVAFVLITYVGYMEFTAPPQIQTQHISQVEASALCDTGIALGEEVRHERSGDFRFYRCYASEQIVPAYQ